MELTDTQSDTPDYHAIGRVIYGLARLGIVLDEAGRKRLASAAPPAASDDVARLLLQYDAITTSTGPVQEAQVDAIMCDAQRISAAMTGAQGT